MLYNELLNLVSRISEVDDFYEKDRWKEFEDVEYLYTEDEYIDNKKEATITIRDKSGKEYELYREGFKNFSYGNYINDTWYDWERNY